MHLTRSLILLAAVVVAAWSLTTVAALAQVEVFSESGNGHCPAMTKDGQHVEGGCHIELFSTSPKVLVAFIPGKVVIGSCDAHMETRIGEDGQGWATTASLTSPPNAPCTRMPCDLPWPIQVIETGGLATAEITFCLRPTIGTGFGICELHLPVTNLGAHEYEIGQSGINMCEAPQAFPLGVENFTYAYEEDSEHIEFVH